MTRINLGILPKDLCDQHLLAEYRELPRLFNFEPKSKAPKEFTLGKGHVLFCRQYMGTMCQRQLQILDEMKHRGFTTNFSDRDKLVTGCKRGPWVPGEEKDIARMLLKIRIKQRLKDMKRKPTWTNRHPPEWVDMDILRREKECS